MSKLKVFFAGSGLVTALLLHPSVTGGAVTAVYEYLTGRSVLVGDCRIRNSDLADDEGGVVVLGRVISNQELHVWGVDADGRTLDVVCETNRPACVQRVVYAVMDSAGEIQYAPGGQRVAKTMVQYELTRRWLRTI